MVLPSLVTSKFCGENRCRIGGGGYRRACIQQKATCAPCEDIIERACHFKPRGPGHLPSRVWQIRVQESLSIGELGQKRLDRCRI